MNTLSNELLTEVKTIWQSAERLHTRTEIEAVCDRMAKQIHEKISENNPLVLCVMIGGVIPTGLLVPRLQFPLQLDYLHYTRYQGKTVGGASRWVQMGQTEIKDRTVLIVDDVFDEGLTLQAIVEYCREQGAQQVYTSVLVEKNVTRAEQINRPDFVGIVTDNRYLFGMGMDYKNYLRNADGIYAVTA